MAKKKKMSPRAAQACKDLLAEGATKKYLACSLDMCPSTLTKRLDEHTNKQLRDENAALHAENERLKRGAPGVIDISEERKRKQA